MKKSKIIKEDQPKPEFFYRVEEFTQWYVGEEGFNESFSDVKDFKGSKLIENKILALAYYNSKLDNARNDKSNLISEPGEEFFFGKDSYGIKLSLIEYYDCDHFGEHPLLGENSEICAMSKEIERWALKSSL